jgi:hypothetical protein
MSALPPKADMCGATRDVRFVPIADIALYSMTSSARGRQLGRNGGAQCLAVFKADIDPDELMGDRKWLNLSATAVAAWSELLF